MTPAVAARFAGRSMLLLLAAIFALNLAWVIRNWSLLRPMAAGDPAPEWQLPEIDREGEKTGRQLALSSLAGRVVLIDFWASWCGPCREAMPLIERFHRELGPRGLAVVSIKTDGEEMAAAKTAIAATSFPILLDEGEVSGRYQVSNLPHLVLLDRGGVVRAVYRGGVDESVLRGEVERLLGEPGAGAGAQ